MCSVFVLTFQVYLTCSFPDHLIAHSLLFFHGPFCKEDSIFYVHVTVYHDKFLIINQTEAPIFVIYFWNETLYVSDSSSVHRQEPFTVHTAMVYVIQVCWQLVSRIRMFHPDPASKLSENLYDIYHCCMYSEKLLMMDRGTVWNI